MASEALQKISDCCPIVGYPTAAVGADFALRSGDQATSRGFLLVTHATRQGANRATLALVGRMTIRSLSMSTTLRRHSSDRRSPVAYSVINMVRCIRFRAESISRSEAAGIGPPQPQQRHSQQRFKLFRSRSHKRTAGQLAVKRATL